MKNVELKIDGDILTITVDLKKRYGKSQGGAGKNFIISSTDGATSLPERNEKVNLTIYTKDEE